MSVRRQQPMDRGLRKWARLSARAWLLATVVLGACAAGQSRVPRDMRAWNRSFPPHAVIGNVYYVGSNEIAQFLITTAAGHILLDSGFEASVPRLRANIEQLGFRFADVKVLLTGHAHIDHVQGHALVRQLTGATVIASAADGAVVSAGGKGEAVFGDVHAWPPCPVDRVVADGDSVTLGGTTLIAHLTPGHTRGAITWTMKVIDKDGGKPLDVVFFPSANVNVGVHLVNNHRYPGIAGDFQRSFAVWKALPCDVFLGVHGYFYGMKEKYERTRSQPSLGRNPFIDPEGYRRFLVEAERRFAQQLASERE